MNILIIIYSIDAKYLSASRAAIQPVPAAVTAWRYILSAASPETNTPLIFVLDEPFTLIMYPVSSKFKKSLKISVLGL